MRTIITVSFLVFLVTYTIGANHSDFDQQPKQLIRELEKNGFLIDSSTIVTGINNNHAKGSYYKIANQNTLAYYYVGRVNSCRSNGCSVGATTETDEAYEFFDYYILFDANGVVKTVKVYNYQATHGMEITIKSWLKQFIGYFGERELTVGKDVDAIAGATISVYSITTDVEYRTKTLNSWLKR